MAGRSNGEYALKWQDNTTPTPGRANGNTATRIGSWNKKGSKVQVWPKNGGKHGIISECKFINSPDKLWRQFLPGLIAFPNKVCQLRVKSGRRGSPEIIRSKTVATRN
jgi:hypothetical protein